MALQSRKISGLTRIKHRLPKDQAPLTKHLSGFSAKPCSALCVHVSVPREQLRKGVLQTEVGTKHRTLARKACVLFRCMADRDTAHLQVSLLSSTSFVRWFVASSKS